MPTTVPKKGLPRILGKHDFTKRHGQQKIKPASNSMKGISDSIGDKNGYDGFSMEGRMEPRANLRYFAKKKGGSYIPINKGLSCTKLLQSAQKHDEA